MAMKRVWAWDLDEMKTAAGTNSRPEAQFHEYPIVSGFTPINALCLSQRIEQQATSDKVISKAKAGKGKAPRKRKTKISGPESLPKVRKAAATRQGKMSKSATDAQSQDISQGLQRTKPTESGNGISFSKAVVPSSVTLLGTDANEPPLPSALPRYQDAYGDCSDTTKLRPSGLASVYRAGCGKPTKDGISPNVLTVTGEGPGSADCFGEPDATRDMLGTETTVEGERGMQQTPGFNERSSIADFAIPPSAQRERSTSADEAPPVWQCSSTLKPDTEDVFNSDDVFGDVSELDEFPINDENLAEILQSVDPSAEIEDSDYGWRPYDFLDDPLIFKDLEDKGSKLHEPSSRSGAATMHGNSIHAPCEKLVLSRTSGNATEARSHNTAVLPQRSEECFDDDDLDEDLADLTVVGSDTIQPQTPRTSPAKPSTPKLQWMAPKTYTPMKTSQMPSTRMDVPRLVPFRKDGDSLPFTRPPFPKPIRDRSPILGLHNRFVLRTCFRIGEALNTAAVASRSNIDAMIELYARIISSEREPNGGFKQFFQFGDLFTDKPPYLSSTYSLWKGLALWDVDSGVFVGEKGRGKMARVMGRIKKCEQGWGCEMVVLSIWEVDWEDVEVAKGIVCS